jgi:hypothetical protein
MTGGMAAAVVGLESFLWDRRSSVENYTCSACNAKFTSQKELDAHMEREHPEAKEPSQPGAGSQKKP